MARLRYNGLVATLGGSGLADGSTTSITFAAKLTHSGGTDVPTLAGGDYIPLSILDGNGVLAEVVYLTAYTAGATTGTITRGQEGTSGAARASGLKVDHGPPVADVAPETWREIGASGQPAFANSWVNHDTAWGSTNTQKAGFRKLANGDVELRGAIKSGAINQAAFQLPTGYRPAKTQIWAAVSHSGGAYQFAAVGIDGTGNVYPVSGSNFVLWLDGVKFTPAA